VKISIRWFLLAVLVLTGCATTAGYEKVLSSWVGDSVDHLISSWGQPASSYQLSDGGRVLEYSSQHNMQFGGITTNVPVTTFQNGTANAYANNGVSATGSYSGTSTTFVPQTSPVQTITMQCSTRFTANSQGIITNWSWQGNDCKAKEPDQTKIQNNGKTNASPEKIALWKKISEKSKAICNVQDYSALFSKTPCLASSITLVHLVDNTKVTQEQKILLLKWRADVDESNAEQRTFLQANGTVADKKVSDFYASNRATIDQYNLDLYNELITWGEYNKRRKELTEKMDAMRVTTLGAGK